MNGLARPTNGRVAAARQRYHRDGSAGMSGGHLLVQLYRRLIRDLDGAIGAIERAEVENAHLQLVHAQDIVDSLDQALDHEAWDQAGQLARIYGHVRRELVRANMTKDASIVVDCRRILEPLAETWDEAFALTSGAAL